MIGKITAVSTAGQVSYLEVAYLAGASDAEPQRFLGKGAEALGLGIQTNEAVRRLCEGQDPATGIPLVQPGRNGQRRAGYEFSLQPDKTVSLAFAFGDEDTQRAVKAAHDAAVARAVAEVERLTDTRRTEDGKREREAVAGIVVAKYDHYASREGDPQLHSHCLLLNHATGQDGRSSAITTERLMASKEIVGQVYQMALYEELAARGLAVEKRETAPTETGRETFTATVVPSLLPHVEAYSTRRQQILAALKTPGSAYAAQAAAMATRKAKNEPPLPVLKAQWRASAPITAEQVRQAAFGAAKRPAETAPTVDELMLDFVTKTAEKKAILTEADIGKHMAKKLALHMGPDELNKATEAAMNSPLLNVAGVGADGQKRFVSDLVVQMEAKMMMQMEAMEAARFSVPPFAQNAIKIALGNARTAGVNLSKEQTGAGNHIILGGNLVTVEGSAGAGKTTIMRVVSDIYKNSGCEVIGCSKAASAADKLGKDADIESSTIDRLNRQLENGEKKLTTKSVVIIDEAGMLDTSTAAKLIDHASKAGAKVIMVGDRKQLQPIGQGGAFTHAATLGKGPFTLTENRRQNEDEHKAEALIFRNGTASQIKAVFDHWQKPDEKGEIRLVVLPTVAETAKAAAMDYYNDKAGFSNKILLAETQAVVSILNVEVQRHRMEAGEIGATMTLRLAPTAVEIDGKETPVHEDVSLALGDRIRFCKNSTAQAGIIDPDTGKRATVLNGDLGTVKEMKRDGEAWLLSVTLDNGRQVAFRTDKYDRIGLGYASTVHKAQGQSVSACYDVSLNPDRHLQYVAKTRHRERSRTYTTGEAIDAIASKSTREDTAKLASKVVAEYKEEQAAKAKEAARQAEEKAFATRTPAPPTPAEKKATAEREMKAQEAKKFLAEQAKERKRGKGQELGFGM